MHAFVLKAAVGSVVGALVGLTGLGSGIVLLPVLIFGLGVPPVVAVGSDALFGALTKVGAGYLHWRQGTVSWRLVVLLALGSIPGAFAGVQAVSYLRTVYGDALNDVLKHVIGILLVCIPLLLLFPLKSTADSLQSVERSKSSWFATSSIGLFAGLLVGMSSVGSGTVVLLILVILIGCSPAVLVGTDIVHAVILTSFTALLYFRLGMVDLGLVIPLLAGSVPGALVGVRLSTKLPSLWVKRVLCLALLTNGVAILWR